MKAELMISKEKENKFKKGDLVKTKHYKSTLVFIVTHIFLDKFSGVCLDSGLSGYDVGEMSRNIPVDAYEKLPKGSVLTLTVE